MIITRIDGGLGNQMFQYAFGRYLATKHDTQLLLDLAAYDRQPAHGYLLDQFQVQAEVVSGKQRRRIPYQYRSTQHHTKSGRVIAGLQEWTNYCQPRDARTLKRQKEKPFGFDAGYLTTANDSYLVGYWQSERFFPGLRDRLTQEFQLKSIGGPSQAVGERVAETNSVALHVRRGDYITDSAAARIYEHLDLEYYRQSVQQFAESHHDVRVFVFSNDIAWCQQELQLDFPTTYVDHNDAATAHEDLWIMSRAACCVIANSTFSWWGAWLNDRPQRQVFAPARWYRPGTLDGRSVNCPEWTILDGRPHSVQQVA